MLSLKKIKKVSDTYNYNFKIYNFDSKTPIIYNNGSEDTYYTFFETESKLYKQVFFKPPNIVFNHSRTEDGIVKYIKKLIGCTIYDGAGINHRPEINASILKSVDNTEYYADDLTDYNVIEYTLAGKNGDQSESYFVNAKLLNARNIYVYRVSKNKTNTYTWYGKYKITGKFSKQHVGENGVMRTIIVLILHKVM